MGAGSARTRQRWRWWRRCQRCGGGDRAAAEIEAADREGRSCSIMICVVLLLLLVVGQETGHLTTNGFRAIADFWACKNDVGVSVEVVQFFFYFFCFKSLRRNRHAFSRKNTSVGRVKNSCWEAEMPYDGSAPQQLNILFGWWLPDWKLVPGGVFFQPLGSWKRKMDVAAPERLKNTHIGGINSACQTLKISGFRAIWKFSPPAHEMKPTTRETA